MATNSQPTAGSTMSDENPNIPVKLNELHYGQVFAIMLIVIWWNTGPSIYLSRVFPTGGRQPV
jgi:hypothetical protein